jgi:hypothetical protein
MRRYSLIARRLILAIAATAVASLAVAAGAQATVVSVGGNQYGIAPVPGSSLPGGMPVTTPGPCNDPSLSPDLHWLTTGLVAPLCYHNGSVIHKNETYVLTWDPHRLYWATTRNFVEQFLSDVAAGSNTFTSPFALTPQYLDSTGRAQNSSIFAGGCVDYGNPNGNLPGGYTCRFGANNPTGTGNPYPANGCPVSGLNVWTGQPNGPLNTTPNDFCLTDAQIKTELQTMLPQMGLPGGSATPVVAVLLPADVEVCLDAAGTACSSNSDSNPAHTPHSSAQFCSYHSTVNVSNNNIAYVVQPWSAQWGQGVGCDDPAAPNITTPIDVTTLANSVGAKLVSPLSQGLLASIVNPNMDGWYASDGSEINDNGCVPLAKPLDLVTVGTNSYALQREFNNAGAIETDPNALPCSPWVNLAPTFVVPGPVLPGDNVTFDGSVTNSTLMIHNGDYQWDFGDGSSASGPSVYHPYANPGNYKVTLSVKDRGGNTAKITQIVQVLGANGQPVPNTGSVPSTTPPSGSGLTAHLQLLPQSLKAVLKNGIAVRVSSNQAANGIATVWITRAAAKRAHINRGHGPAVRIGIGTVASITNGTVTLRLHLSRSTATKLAHLGHVTMTIRLALVASGNQRFAIDVAGRY